MPALNTISTHFFQARSVNQTSNGYVSKVPTKSEPVTDVGTATGQSAFSLSDESGGISQNRVKFWPYGTGADGTTFSMRMIGWRCCGKQPSNTAAPIIWVPVTLIEIQATLSSALPGVAGSIIPVAMFFAKTITVTSQPLITGTINAVAGNLGAQEIYSSGTTVSAWGIVQLYGAQWLECSFTTGGSATDANCLLTLL